MTFEEHLARWSALHGGTNPHDTRFVVGWLRIVHVLGSRLRVSPDVLTVLAVVAAIAVLFVPPWVGAFLIVLSSLLDGLDGSVALLQDRVTRHGAVLDAVGDRISDGAFVLALVLAGAPVWLGIACAAGIVLIEGARLVARRVIAITVAERPTRVIATAVGLVSIPTVGLAALAVATAVGVVQLAVAWRRP